MLCNLSEYASSTSRSCSHVNYVFPSLITNLFHRRRTHFLRLQTWDIKYACLMITAGAATSRRQTWVNKEVCHGVWEEGGRRNPEPSHHLYFFYRNVSVASFKFLNRTEHFQGFMWLVRLQVIMLRSTTQSANSSDIVRPSNHVGRLAVLYIKLAVLILTIRGRGRSLGIFSESLRIM